MTFSPFYMGNHTTPFDETMTQQTYTVAENWGGQINFMIPLDRKGLNRCRSIAARQEEKMRLDYELVRALKCAELQQKGFMIMPNTRVSSMCSDIIPIKTWKTAVDKVLKCKTPPKPWYKPWSKPKETCNMSTLNPFKPDVVTPRQKTSLELSIEKQAKEAAEAKKSEESKSE